MRKLFAIFLLSSVTVSAQLEDLGTVADDFVFLSNQYISPAAEATVFQSSGGWYTSAKKKELWDVEFSTQGNFLFVPNRYKSFLIDENELQNFTIQGDGTTALVPSALGGDDFVVLEGQIGDDSFQFDSPEGINISTVKHAQFQVSLGLFYGTTLIGKYSPKIKINKTHYQIYGLGLLHNLSQWFSQQENHSTEISFLLGYSFFNVSDTFSEVDLPLGTLNSVGVDGKSLLFNLIASKDVNNFTFSAALGLTNSRFEYSIGGSGELLVNTLNHALETLNKDKTNFKADLGANYNFGDFSLSTMLVMGRYFNLTFGFNYNL